MILSKYAIPSLTVSIADIKNRRPNLCGCTLLMRRMTNVFLCDFMCILLRVFHCVYCTAASA